MLDEGSIMEKLKYLIR